MLRRITGRARAGTAAGMFLVLAVLAPALRGDEPADPLPGPGSNVATVSLLRAAQAGQIQIDARGHDDQQVRLVIRNATDRRLHIVFPPGLVAAAATGQGFQSMGLGTPTSNPGSFGEFRGNEAGEGFHSMPASATVSAEATSLAIGASQMLELSVPAVCLDFGLPTPTPADSFQLMDVDDYTHDVRARKALRSLVTLGTSQKVAQAVAWNVFNDLGFGAMTVKAAKLLNRQEIALAARFVQALDTSSAANLVEPDQIRHGRVFVQITGAGPFEALAARLARELETQSLLGLPVRVVDQLPDEQSAASALFLAIRLAPGGDGSLRGQVAPRYRAGSGGWQSLPLAAFDDADTAEALDPVALVQHIDRAMAGALVSARPERRETGTTMFRIQNRLPFTIARLTARAGAAADSGRVEIDRLGLGPARATLVALPTATAVVERIELNGL